MAAMKITEWPRYKKTGSPTEKKRHEAERIAALLFAEVLPSTSQRKQQNNPAAKLRKAAEEAVASDRSPLSRP
jgi:hypothetical protein